MKIGVDIGGMSIKIGLVNEKNEILAKKVIPTETDIAYQKMIKKIGNAVRELLEEENITLKDCDGVGIGCPGMIDDENGVVIYSNNIRWKEVPLAREMKKYLDTEIRIANDADAAALGEVCAGAAKDTEDAVLLTLGTGVGSGVILKRKIFHGALVGGCELGHISINYNGVPCTCGRKGCFEMYASASALLRIAREAAKEYPESVMNEMCGYDLTEMSGKIPFDAAKQDDAAGKKALEEYEDYLACGIANVINIFRPQKVIIGGGVAKQKENLTDPLQERVTKLCFGGESEQIAQIVTSELGNDAGIIGAANLV